MTDAHLLLGRLDPDRFLSGELEADVDRVESVVEDRIADPLGLSVREAAQGVLDVADANMERALRVVSVERGHDPREFGLVAFGGAGPLHAGSLAEALGVPRVFVPRTAGVLSALGLLVTDLAQDYSTSMVRRLSEADPEDVESALADFERDGRERLADAVPADRVALERSLDLRYVGQSFELTVPLPDVVDEVSAETLSTVEERFHAAHQRRYGHASPDEPVELVTVRARARGLVEPPEIAPAETEGSVTDAVLKERSVTFDGEPRETRVYERARLPAEGGFEGPAVVQGAESTVVVRPGQNARVDEFGTLVLEVGP